MEIHKALRESLLELYTQENKLLRVFHGIHSKNVEPIKMNGLQSKTGYDSPTWYMVCTDIESAIYHATPIDEGGEVYVFEFELPVTNDKWDGYPYFWPGYERNSTSTWFALKQPLPKDTIKEIHNIPYSIWSKQKDNGY